MIAGLAETSNFNVTLLMPPARSACPVELASLLDGVRAGEQHALEHFYRLTIGRVFGMALRIVRCRATAEEVAADVYVQVWYSADSFDQQRGAALAWVLTICRSRAIDRLRRADKAIVDPDPTERLDAISELVPSLQDLLQATQEHAALHSAITRLRPEQRQFLSMAFFRGLTHAEIAAEVQVPLGTVKTHIRRALAVLRKELGRA